MQKFGDSEQAEVLSGREANVLHSYMERIGKFQVSEFEDADREALNEELKAARVLNDADEFEHEKRREAAEKAVQTREENKRKMEEDNDRLRAEEKLAQKESKKNDKLDAGKSSSEL